MHASPLRATFPLPAREIVNSLFVRNNLSGSSDLEKNDLSVVAGTQYESVPDLFRWHTIRDMCAGDDVPVSHPTMSELAIPHIGEC